MNNDKDEDDLFVPLRPFPRPPGGDWRARKHRERERFVAGHHVRGLSRTDIVGTAIAVADADGTEAVSMRRIAREMRVGAMSLYWYVSSKEELLQLMLERVQAEGEAPEPTGDWRADLRGYARNTRAALLRHPWAIDFLGHGPPSGPNDARNLDRLIGALDGLGLDLTAVMYIAMTLGTFVLGAVLREVQEMRWQRSMAETTAGWTEADFDELYNELDRRVRQSGRYPHLVRVLDADVDPDAPETRDERFEFGLGCVLDGIAARLPSLFLFPGRRPVRFRPRYSLSPGAPAGARG